MKRIILAGAGHAHIVALRHFARHRPPDCKIFLINDGAYAWYTGALPALVRGDISSEQARLDVEKLATNCGVTFINAKYTGYNGNFVNLENGDTLEFDALALSIGAQAIPGGVKPIPKFLDRLAHWERLPVAKIGIIGSGVAGVELALALQARLNRSAEIHLQVQHNGLLPNTPRKVRGIALHSLKKSGISLGKCLPMPFDDVIHAYTPEPTIKVRTTLQVLDRDDVFATGDCASFPKTLPRSGAIAVREGRVLAYNLTHTKPKEFRRPLASLAIMGLSSHKAIAWYGTESLFGQLPMLWKKWLDRRWLDDVG